MSIEKDLCSRQSFDAIKYVLDGVELHPLQCIDVMKMLYNKKSVVVYDTGLGKTVLSAAVMKLLWRENPSRKFIFVGMHDQLVQTPQKLENMCGRRVIAADASAKGLKNLKDARFWEYSILFITHESLLNDKLMNEIFKYRNQYCGIFIDEAHELSNTGYAKSATILAGMVRQFDYRYALTATPIVSSVSQMSKLMSLMDNEAFPNAKRLESGIKNGTVDVNEYPLFVISRSRQEFEDDENGEHTIYNGITEFVDPLPHQKCIRNESMLFQICKGEGAYPQVKRLVSIVKNREDQRGLIYIRQHDVRRWVLPFLEKAGIRYACINGSTSTKQRAEIMHQFNDLKAYDVIITSVTTAVDLDCDYVVFYEFTVLVKQMIGRAHRGLQSKILDVIFIITDDTKEVDYFYDNIFKISMFIRDLLQHDYTELEQVDYAIQSRIGGE